MAGKGKTNGGLPSSPHIAARDTVSTVMLDLLISLVPALLVGVYFFGPRAAVLTLVTVLAAVAAEAVCCLAMKRRVPVADLSAAVTGLLLALCLPVETPYWAAVTGAVFAVVVVKQLFGGLGKNFMNPALAGRVFLFSFPALMGKFTAPGAFFWVPVAGGTDAVSAATPMAALHAGTIPPGLSLQQLLVGQRAGCIGEVAALMLLLGGLYLVVRRVITLRIPLVYLATVAALTYLLPPAGTDPGDWMLYNLLSGGLMLGAIFMATDPVTSPVTPIGQTIYALGCGGLTVFLRTYGAYPEGVAFAILLMNAAAWSLDKLGGPRRSGAPKGTEQDKEVEK